MPEYLAPGVFIEEVEMGAKPIEGVSTSTVGFLGETERGPTKPTLVTSWNQYQRIFGSYFGITKYLPYAVQGFFANGGKRCYIARVTSSENKAYLNVKIDSDSYFKVEAIGEGNWGGELSLKFSTATIDGFKLSIYFKDSENVSPIEVFDNLSFSEGNIDFYLKRINGISNFIYLEVDTDFDGELPECDVELNQANLNNGVSNNLNYGINNEDNGENNDPKLKINHFTGENSEKSNLKGLNALSEIDGISILYLPPVDDADLDVGTTNVDIATKLVNICDSLKDRFAIIDVRQINNEIELPQNLKSEKGYAAFYHPWVKITNPQGGGLITVPPGGHVAGVYARSDVERGVFKAPANEILRGVSDLELTITNGEQEVLNPKGINAIRSLPGRGIRVWGARTTSPDPLWKYVNIRRLFIFIEQSIERNTQWVVFEPNNERLWDRVVQTVDQFLTQLWKDGALMGNTPEEGFFVKCDRTTMSPLDIETGKLVVMIGVAPTKPAEFVVFRIAQWTAGA